ncbi:TadE/TadG family type IV pilus assembly protein [Vibrio sp. SCSIO 43137]|uniref:TadE/TadG family type IV pilus assembly protein n=1 Tax=Vibrio sp. SCSIO 43137 TaxID=3021011 RepID=UPI002307D408|nr:TadE/TadG family type IV pilus assembly protein [Vibrio sp. SCSIO 43137]WCE32563.1 TadE/TadG family type IV pilus assembly protein [Vibrio sp. SCSIO 43137]
MIKRNGMGGTIAVEAAIGLPVLLFVVLLWVELCFIFYAISSTEHAFASAVIYAKKVNIEDSSWEKYQDIVELKLKESKSARILWGRTTVPSSVSINVTYFKEYAFLSQCSELYLSSHKCPSGSSDYKNGAIAIYSLSYTYQPLLLNWLPAMPIKREIMAVQEYERCALTVSGRSCD